MTNQKERYIPSLLQILKSVNGRGMEQKKVFRKLRGEIRRIEGISGVVDHESYVLTEEVLKKALKRRLIEEGSDFYLGEIYKTK
ncbi:MAG: hypothetical protein KKF67_04020 [Nanoarchaeota archaeon]|nr:hypothetical protein [Nanoarchaeota archaeon]